MKNCRFWSYIALLVFVLSLPSFAYNTVTLANSQIVNNGTNWTLAFDLVNQGPAKDAVFKVQLPNLPAGWKSYSSNPLYVSSNTVPVIDLTDGSREAWEYNAEGFRCGNGSGKGDYRIFGQSGAPLSIGNTGNSAHFEWAFVPGSGLNPALFDFTTDNLKVHIQMIGDDWANDGGSYVGGMVVPEPSTIASLFGLSMPACLLAFRRRK